VAAKRKVQKYSNEASILRKQGYRVYLGFVVGALGAWYPGNNAALNAIGIHKKHHKKLASMLIGGVIENSTTIFLSMYGVNCLMKMILCLICGLKLLIGKLEN
jgi:uncharacterized membrane protein SpoIIM required for sporulation